MISNVTNSRGRIIPQTNLMLNFRFLILHPVWKILFPVQKMISAFEDQILLWSRRQKHKILDRKKAVLKSVWKWMFLYKWPLYDHFWPFVCHMYVHLSKNWGSDGHFEVLNRSYLWLVEKLWRKTQIFPFLFFCDFVQKQIFASFLFFTFLCFLS